MSEKQNRNKQEEHQKSYQNQYAKNILHGKELKLMLTLSNTTEAKTAAWMPKRNEATRGPGLDQLGHTDVCPTLSQLYIIYYI